jgi:uncharacterized OB-fold protein
MSLPLLKPALYAVSSDSEPVLLGGTCTCGHTFFPMQTYGCERCGRFGDALTPKPLSGRGRLIAAATVHTHTDPKRSAPFVVGTIALDDGPVVRTLLDGPLERVPQGRRVRAVLSRIVTERGEALDLRFKLEQAADA